MNRSTFHALGAIAPLAAVATVEPKRRAPYIGQLDKGPPVGAYAMVVGSLRKHRSANTHRGKRAKHGRRY